MFFGISNDIVSSERFDESHGEPIWKGQELSEFKTLNFLGISNEIRVSTE